jgi:hypothetical protein
MKLTFKDLKQQKFTIDAEPSETVGQVKEKISTEKGWEVPQLKLIYSGKILQDDKTVESYNIEEKGFIVCMVSKVIITSIFTVPDCWMEVDYGFHSPNPLPPPLLLKLHQPLREHPLRRQLHQLPPRRRQPPQLRRSLRLLLLPEPLLRQPIPRP